MSGPDAGPMINGRNLNELLAMPDIAELNGRLTCLQQQRNDANDSVVVMQGRLALAEKQLAAANAEVARLGERLQQLESERAPAPASDAASPLPAP